MPGADITLVRVPGAKAKNFFNDPRFYQALDDRYELVVLWLGSNDIAVDTQVGDVLACLGDIVNAIKERCKAIVQVCLIEPRVRRPGITSRDRTFNEKYKIVARHINRRLTRYCKGCRVLNFAGDFFESCLAEDGVHFNRLGRELVRDKLKSAIEYKVADWAAVHGMGGFWPAE